jgi:hypothetical protein
MESIPATSIFDHGDDSWIRGTLGPLSGDAVFHPDLITFLAAAQQHAIEMIPIVWQDGLGFLGKGGTADISQAPVDTQTAFAFKRTPTQRDGFNLDLKDLYHLLTMEIHFLRHPFLLGHPNIAQLEGICWEVTQEAKVLPVLLFEKAEQGDVKRFALSQAEIISFDAKLDLCIDIANGIHAMHAASSYSPLSTIRYLISLINAHR